MNASRRLYLRSLQVVYDLAYALVVLLASPLLLVMLLVSSRWRSGLVERLGFCDRRTGAGPALWIHGVSVGEVLAAKELVNLIDDEMPWLEVVLSTTTRTGRAAAKRAYPGKLVVYFPLDFSFCVRRVMRRLRPTLVLLMELELWPNFLIDARRGRVPVLLANGRMSTKSQRRYRMLRRVIPEPLERVSYYCVQSQEYADRFRSLGVADDRMAITGSMKFDTVADDLPPDTRQRYLERLGIAEGTFVLLGGSTHTGEEALLLQAFREIRARDPRARLVLCPRHPERLGEAEEAIRQARMRSVRLKTLPAGEVAPPLPEDCVVLVDTMGELARLYLIADLVFVGGSLTRRGGQNMMEPAGLGKPVVVGPNTWNFRDPVELLLSHRGLLQVRDAAELRRELVALHVDRERRETLGRRARELCVESKGATRRIFEILRQHAPAAPPRDPGPAPATHPRSSP